MPLLELYMQTTGSDLNAGTDNTTTPIDILPSYCTVTAGTITFTAATGTPFSGATAGSTWVSFYNSTDTATRFTGLINSITGGGSTITVLYNSGTGYSTTGLGLATGLTGTVYCRIGGAWASLAITGSGSAMNAPTSSGAWSTYNGLRVNVKAGTYTSTSAITFPAGTAAKPIWWRGYYSTLTGTPGSAAGFTSDLDNCANVAGTIVGGPTGATRPQFTNSVVNATSFTLGSWVIYENMEFTSTASTGNGQAVNVGGSNVQARLIRCRFSGNSGGGTTAGINGFVHAVGCYFYAATYFNINANGGNHSFIGCTLRGGSQGVYLQSGGTLTIAFSILESSTYALYCVSTSAAAVNAINNVFSSCINAIYTSSTSLHHILGANNYITNCTNAISINGTTNLWPCDLLNSGFFSNTNPLTGVWESYQRSAQTDTTANLSPYTSPFVSTSTHDFTLVSTSYARKNGFPGQLEV